MINSKVTPIYYAVDHEESTARTEPSLVIPTQNLLLASLPPKEINQIVGDAKAVQLKPSEMIFADHDEIDHLYFPITAVISSVAILEDGSTVEISMTGREGIVGLPALVGGGHALHWTRVSVGGTAVRVSTATMRQHFRRSEAVHEAILRAYRYLFTQICQRSVCNVRHTLLQRLCVWLLMINDRVGSHELPFTQEEIASRISVRRASISVAASMLQAMHAISYHRGKIVITDRIAIEATACECYRVLGHEFHQDANQTRALGSRF